MRFQAFLASLALVVGGAVMAPAAHAVGGQLYTWIGSSGADPKGDNTTWSDPLNWSPTGIPVDGDSVSIAPPTADVCYAHVSGMPSVSLVDFSLADATINGSLCLASVAGTGLTVTHSLTWHGGQLQAPTTIASGATGTISPTSNVTSELDSDLTVAGTLNLTGNVGGSNDRSVVMDAGVTITVAHGASMHTNNTNHVETLSCCNNPSKVVNNGTIVDADNLSFDYVELDQNATLDAHGANAVVTSWAAPTTAASGAHYTGGGTYRVSGASIEDKLAGTQTFDRGFRFILGGGRRPFDPGDQADGNETLGGTFTLAGAGSFQWIGGHIYGHATLSTTGGVTVAANPEDKYVSPDPQNNASTVRTTVHTSVASGARSNKSYLNVDGGSTFTFGGTTTIGQDVILYHGNLVNTGNLTIRAAADNPTSASAAGFSNKGTLTVASGAFTVDNDYVQTAGSTTVAHGARLTEGGSSSVVRVKGGRLSGTGLIAGAVYVSGGQVTPGGTNIGTLSIGRGYTQGTRAAAAFDLAGSSGDLLAVHGPTTLAGTVRVHNEYRPTASSSRTLVSSASSLTAHLTCVTTSGTGATGTAARHWQARDAGSKLVVTSVRGRRTSC